MITVSTTSAGEAQVMADLFRAAPAWLDWRVYHLGALTASSGRLRTWAAPETGNQDAR